MTNTVGIVGANAGSIQAPAASVYAPTASSSTFAATVGSTTPAAALQTPVHNPILINDPYAGLITEYLSANGSQIISQTPTAVTVAYLRSGLTADGDRKPSTTTI